MIDDMIGGFLDTSFDGLIMLLQEHQLIASTLTPFFAGEYSIHLFGILNGSGDISLTPAIIATGSIIFFDILIYSTVRIVQKNKDVAGRMRKVKFFAKIETLFKKHQERYGKNPTLLLIAVKLMPMTKVTLIFFALYQKMSLLRFIIRDILISIIWVAIIFLPGWLVGKELLTEEVGRQVSTFIIYALLLIVLIFLFGDKINRCIMRIVAKIAGMVDKKKDRV